MPCLRKTRKFRVGQVSDFFRFLHTLLKTNVDRSVKFDVKSGLYSLVFKVWSVNLGLKSRVCAVGSVQLGL